MENSAHSYTEQKHTELPWFSYPQHPDRFYLGAYRRGSLCISVGKIAPRDVLTAAGDESITEEEAIANRDFILKACNAYYSQSSEIERLTEWKNEAEKKLIEAGQCMGLQSEEIERLREALIHAKLFIEENGSLGRIWRYNETVDKMKSALQPQK